MRVFQLIDQRALLYACMLFAFAFLAILVQHRLGMRLPCPNRAGEFHEVLIEDVRIVAIGSDGVTVHAFAKNNSRRVIGGLTSALIANAHGDPVTAEAENNEPGAPSITDAPILPGASRAIRFHFKSAASSNPELRVVACWCE